MGNNIEPSIDSLIDNVEKTLASNLVINPEIPHKDYKSSINSTMQATRHFVCADDSNLSTEQLVLIRDLLANENYKLLWEKVLVGLAGNNENYLNLIKYQNKYSSSDLLQIWGVEMWMMLDLLHKADILNQENVDLLVNAAAKSLEELDSGTFTKKYHNELINFLKQANNLIDENYKNLLRQPEIIINTARVRLIVGKLDLLDIEKEELLNNPERVNAVTELVQKNLLDEGICTALLRSPPEKAMRVAKAFTMLRVWNLLNDENRAVLLENTQYAYEIASAYVALNEQKALNNETRSMVLANPHTALAQTLIKPFLIDDLKSYIDTEKEQKNYGFSFFQSTPKLTNNSCEISAANKLIKFLEGQEDVEFEEDERDALTNNTGVGVIVSSYKNQASSMDSELELPADLSKKFNL